MANRFFESRRYSLEKKIVDIYFKVAIGAVGAPTIDAANSKGVASIVRNAAGKYTITLQDTYNKFLNAGAVVLNATGIPASPNFGVVSQAVGSATPTVVVQFSSGGIATELASGDTVYGEIELGNTSAI